MKIRFSTVDRIIDLPDGCPVPRVGENVVLASTHEDWTITSVLWILEDDDVIVDAFLTPTCQL